MKRSSAIIWFLLFFCLSSCEDDDLAPIDDYESAMIGNWIPTQLIINGVDTTNFLIGDSACYPKLEFYIQDGLYHGIITSAGYGSASNFHCSQFGNWSRISTRLYITMQQDVSNIGPFLSKETISWSISSSSSSTLSLGTTFHGEVCSLKLQKIN